MSSAAPSPDPEVQPRISVVDLDMAPERLPEPGGTLAVAGIAVPVVALSALEASAPIKVEAALKQFGLS